MKSFLEGTVLPILFICFVPLISPGDKAVCQEEIKVKIGSSGRGVVKLGVEPFQIVADGEELKEEREIVYSILLWDLDFSLQFDVTELDEEMESTSSLDRKKLEEIFTKDWIDRGVDVFVRGRISKEGNDFVLGYTLKGPASEKSILERSYRVSRSEFRSAVHRISDDIIFAMTGNHGISMTRIAFISKRTGNKELFIADCDGFNEKRLTQNRSINISPAWSPFGDEIIFTSFRDGNPDLFIFNMKNSSVRKYVAYPGINNAAAWSPDGKDIAVTLSKDGNPEIYLVDFWTGKIRRITHSGGIDTSPSWSPTGNQIAFMSDRAGTPAIYVMDRDGSNVRRVTFIGNYNASPAWSPLGDRIAFVGRSVDEGNTDLYVVEISGENLMRISAIGDNVDPDWSPDGYHVAFASNRDGAYDIYTITWDGADLKRITYSGQNYSPAWSPVVIR